MFPRGEPFSAGEKKYLHSCYALDQWLHVFLQFQGPPNFLMGIGLMPGNERNTTTAGPAVRAYAEAVADGV